MSAVSKSPEQPGPPRDTALQLKETQAAFDSVAPDYDGPRGNNEAIQEMRAEMWRWLDRTFANPGRLVDLGCGTGLDAVRMARRGHEVTATDWSPLMVERTRARAAAEQLASRVHAVAVGAHELERLGLPEGALDGAYSNLGPLNCVPDLGAVARECARLVRPGGALVFTVIGRVCPWELAHYLARGRWARARVRFARDVVPVGMNRHTIWTRYYTPRAFHRAFTRDFALEHFRGVCLLAPPPYLTAFRARHARLCRALFRLDQRIAGWPLLRGMGDHFLMVLRRR
jgi:SAM-dependent methyltransferase